MSPHPTPEAGQLLRLSLAELRCGVNIAGVREILKPVPLTALPLMPGFVCGVMNLRGSVVPVIDLAELLGLGRATRTRRSCIVIVETGAPGARLVTGLLVDAVHEVAAPEADGLEPVPPLGTEIAGEHLAGIARLRGEPMPVLALDEILDEQRLSARIGTPAEAEWRLAA